MDDPKTDKNEISITDRLLLNHIITHLDHKRLESMLEQDSNDFRKTLIMADFVASKTGENEIYNIIASHPDPEAMAVYSARNMGDEIITSISRIYSTQRIFLKPLVEIMAEDYLHSILQRDYSAYRHLVPTPQQGIFTICDTILTISGYNQPIRDLKQIVRNGITYIEGAYETDDPLIWSQSSFMVRSMLRSLHT
jgi:hypothetical protein